MPSCKYQGTFGDFSGYGQANRNFIAALYHGGVDVTTEQLVQVAETADYGWTGKLAKALEGRNIDYKIKIIHLTPDLIPRYMEKDKYNISHLFWETDRLPNPWIKPLNLCNEIWTASEQQAEMIKSSGVTVPIYSFPQPIDVLPMKKKVDKYVIPHFKGVVFYSIFQWIERKNPRALITNFWKTFEGKNDVILLLKTYGNNYSKSEFEKIKDDLRGWKKQLNLSHYPRILLINKLLPTDKMFKLHATGDCFISTSRGEGWCIPAAEAGLMGNPIISIDQTGFTDYLTEEMYLPCSATIDQVQEQSSIPWYKADQNWLEISAPDLVKQMLKVYTNRKETKAVGLRAQEYIKDQFNYWVIGKKLHDRLEEIEKGL